MKILCTFAFSLIILTGCTVQQPTQQAPVKTAIAKPAHYKTNETSKMTLCVGLTDNAFSIAGYKLKNRPIAEVKAEYASNPAAELVVPLVDKIYSDTFSYSWNYAVSFFEECALNMTNIPATRVDFASYCAQNMLIASVAKKYKDSNAPIESAYQFFSGFGSSPKKIVDDTYKSTKTRQDILLDAWNSCMSPITGDV